MQAGEAAMIDASVPAIAASQLRMEGEISGLVQGEQAASQTLVEVDKELEWLAAALGLQDSRAGLQTAMQRLVGQVALLEGRGGTTTLEYGQDNELNTVATLQSRMESDVTVITPTQNSLAEVVFEVYQELARINARLGKQDGQPGQVVIAQEPGQVVVQQMPAAAPQVVQYHSVGQSQMRSVSWAPGAAVLQQAPAAPAPAMAMAQPNLPAYGPPTTVVAPAQYMMPMTSPAASASIAVEQAAPAQQISIVVPQEPTLVTQTPPVAYSAPAAAPQPVATQTAQLPALAPTTVVAAAQYMMPGSITAVPATMTMPAEAASASLSVSNVMQPPFTVSSVSQPVPMEPTAMVQAPAQTLPALAPTTVVAPAQYMAPGTASVGVPVGTTNAPVPVATGSLAAPSATMGQFISMPPGVSSTVTVPGSAQTGSMVLSGAGVLPMRGSLLKAGSITDDVFNMVDKDNDGVISRSEFRGALKGNVISATASTRLALQGHM